MKKESTQDVFETQYWLYDVITEPYQVFAEAFSTLTWIKRKYD